MYDPQTVQPIRDELIQAGFTETQTKESLTSELESNPKTHLFFVNSICGCSAGTARPGIIDAISNDLKPEKIITAFAGNDTEAVSEMREQMVGYPPSSPCIALFRDGKLVHMVERHQIEGQSADTISKVMKSAFDKFCGEEVNQDASVFDPEGELCLDASTLKALLSTDDAPALLDVREEHEVEQYGTIEGAQRVTNELANTIVSDWGREKMIVVFCASGARSVQAVQFLRQHGFEQSFSLDGGLSAYQAI